MYQIGRVSSVLNEKCDAKQLLWRTLKKEKKIKWSHTLKILLDFQ